MVFVQNSLINPFFFLQHQRRSRVPGFGSPPCAVIGDDRDIVNKVAAVTPGCTALMLPEVVQSGNLSVVEAVPHAISCAAGFPAVLFALLTTLVGDDEGDGIKDVGPVGAVKIAEFAPRARDCSPPQSGPPWS